jgi:hypothetical protein
MLRLDTFVHRVTGGELGIKVETEPDPRVAVSVPSETDPSEFTPVCSNRRRAFALAVRNGAVALDAVLPLPPAMLGLLFGGMASAYFGTRLVRRLSDQRLVRLIALLLAVVGVLLITEAFLPFHSSDLLPAIPWRISRPVLRSVSAWGWSAAYSASRVANC